MVVAGLVAVVALIWIVNMGLMLLVLINGHHEDEPRPFDPQPARLVVEVDYASRQLREHQLVLRLAPIDQDALGLQDYVIQPNHWRNFEMWTPHMLTSRDQVYEHCLMAEAVVHDYTASIDQHVFPAGTCLRSDEPTKIEIAG